MGSAAVYTPAPTPRTKHTQQHPVRPTQHNLPKGKLTTGKVPAENTHGNSTSPIASRCPNRSRTLITVQDCAATCDLQRMPHDQLHKLHDLRPNQTHHLKITSPARKMPTLIECSSRPQGMCPTRPQHSLTLARQKHDDNTSGSINPHDVTTSPLIGPPASSIKLPTSPTILIGGEPPLIINKEKWPCRSTTSGNDSHSFHPHRCD